MGIVTPLPRRDSSLVFARILPALHALIKTGYLSLSVEGVENIPRTGEVIFVENHCGWFTLDGFLSGLAIVDSTSADRLPYVAVQDQLLKVPWLGSFFARAGSFPASWLRDPADLNPEMTSLLVYPEGTEGNCKPFWKAYQMRRWHTGFARVAAARGMPVVPVAAIGGEECLPVAATVRFLKPLLGTILPLPLFPLPLPARWTLIFHEPVRVQEAALGRRWDDPDSLYRRYARFAESVRSTVQITIDRETASHQLVKLARALRYLDRDRESEIIAG